MRRQHRDRARQVLQPANIALVLHRIARPILDRADRGHGLDETQQGLVRIAEPAGQRIVEADQWQAGRGRDRREMGQRHFRPELAPHAHALRWKDQQCGGAVGLGEPGNAGGFEAAIGIDPGDDRQPVAELVHREAHDLALLIDRAGMHFGGMAIDGQRRNTGDRGDIAQMLAIGGFVDREIGFERQQHRRDDALRQPILEARHRHRPPAVGMAECRSITQAHRR